MIELTNAEIKILLDAIDAWVRMTTQGMVLAKIVEGKIVGHDMTAKEQVEFERMRESLHKKINEESENREEIAILLKAKLVQMKNQKESPNFKKG